MNDPDWEFRPAAPEPPTYFWWIFLVVVFGIILLSIGIARADTGPHVITVYAPGKDYDQVRRTHFVLGDPPFVYDGKTACNVAIVRVRVHLSGARLQCNPHYPTDR